MTIIANTTAYKLIEALMKGEGKTTAPVTTDMPIAGWNIEGGRADPITIPGRRPDAIYRIKDPAANCWYSLDGDCFSTWQSAVAELWSNHDERERQKRSESLENRMVPLAKAGQTASKFDPPGWDEKKVVAELERKDREWRVTASAWARFRERINLPPPGRGKLIPWEERRREAEHREDSYMNSENFGWNSSRPCRPTPATDMGHRLAIQKTGFMNTK